MVSEKEMNLRRQNAITTFTRTVWRHTLLRLKDIIGKNRRSYRSGNRILRTNFKYVCILNVTCTLQIPLHSYISFHLYNVEKNNCFFFSLHLFFRLYALFVESQSTATSRAYGRHLRQLMSRLLPISPSPPN